MAAEIFTIVTMVTFLIAARAQVLATTNIPASGTSSASSEPAGDGPIVPLIEMHDVPLNLAIQDLARDAGVNYLLAPEFMQKWIDSGEPIVNFKLTNAIAKEVLKQMLSFRNMTLLEDPAANIALIVPASQRTNALFGGLATNTASLHTNLIPLIQFWDAPITTVIENLARQEDVNYILDPRLSELWGPGHKPEPMINLRFANVTCWNTLNRMLNLYNLIFVENPATHISRITFVDAPVYSIDSSLLEMATSSASSSASIPLIQFADVPLDSALENLIRQCGAHIDLTPQLKDECLQGNLVVNVRWTNVTARQAIIALCENYGLVISKNEATGAIEIKPSAAKRH